MLAAILLGITQIAQAMGPAAQIAQNVKQIWTDIKGTAAPAILGHEPTPEELAALDVQVHQWAATAHAAIHEGDLS